MLKREMEYSLKVGRLGVRFVLYPWWEYDFGFGIHLEFWNKIGHGYFRIMLYRVCFIVIWFWDVD